MQLLEQPGTNQNYSDSRQCTFLYFARPRFGTSASYHLASWLRFAKKPSQGYKLWSATYRYQILIIPENRHVDSSCWSGSTSMNRYEKCCQVASSWSSAITIATNQSSEDCFCIDFRSLNDQTVDVPQCLITPRGISRGQSRVIPSF